MKTKHGFALIDQDDCIMYNDFEMTEKEFRQWYANKISNNYNWRVVKITLKEIN